MLRMIIKDDGDDDDNFDDDDDDGDDNDAFDNGDGDDDHGRLSGAGLFQVDGAGAADGCAVAFCCSKVCAAVRQHLAVFDVALGLVDAAWPLDCALSVSHLTKQTGVSLQVGL